ncbi:hypothetical protein [Actibacterium sp. D379-3]
MRPGRPSLPYIAAALVAVSGAAHAASDAQRALFPAAQCAAFWLGYGDFQSRYAIASGDAADAYRVAADFRAAAIRLGGGDATAVDAYISEQRPLMLLMNKSFMIDGNRESQDMFDRLARTCDDFATTQPETREQP